MSSATMNMNAQLEHLQSKHVGTGHADTNKFEWAVNQHRDTFASVIGHNTVIAYNAIAENQSIGRKKFELLEKMIQPCGLPIPRED